MTSQPKMLWTGVGEAERLVVVPWAALDFLRTVAARDVSPPPRVDARDVRMPGPPRSVPIPAIAVGSCHGYAVVAPSRTSGVWSMHAQARTNAFSLYSGCDKSGVTA